MGKINWEDGSVTWGMYRFSPYLTLDIFPQEYPDLEPITQGYGASFMPATVVEIPEIEQIDTLRAQVSLLFLGQHLDAIRIAFLLAGETDLTSDDYWDSWNLLKEFERLMIGHEFLYKNLGTPNGEIKSLWDYDIKQLNEAQIEKFRAWTYRLSWGHIISTYSPGETSGLALGYPNKGIIT